MRTIAYTGTLTALSSIAHGDGTAGTVKSLRREKIVTADGEILFAVPIISGSVIRGGLRRRAATLMHDALVGDGRLPFTVVHALRTGGSLTETRSQGEVLTGERQAVLRDLVPLIGLFGASGGGRIISGRLVVDKAVPLARETAHLGAVAGGAQLASVFELVQVEQYSQRADVNDAEASTLIEEGQSRDLAKGSGTMRWSQETLIPGTKLLHRLVGEDLTPVEVSFLEDLVSVWATWAIIGGQKARGCGRVRVDYVRTVTDLAGRVAEPEPAVNWRDHVAKHRDEAIKALGWL